MRTLSIADDAANVGIYAPPVHRLWWLPNRCCCRWPPKRTTSAAVGAATTIAVGLADDGEAADVAIDAADGCAAGRPRTNPHHRTPAMRWTLHCDGNAGDDGVY